MKRTLALLLALMMLLALLVGCGGEKAAEDEQGEPSGEVTGEETAGEETTGEETALKPIAKEDMKVGFVYIGDINDGGYTQAHDAGRLAIEAMGIECLYKENVPENNDCDTAIRELIDAGCNVIYATSFGHGEFTKAVAEEYPNIYFGHATGQLLADNMCNYMGRVIEARYLSGIVAGMASESGKLGYVMAQPYAECIRGCNAFTMGVRSVNPEATVDVVVTNNWYDVALEKQAANELLGRGCDVIAQHADSPAAQLAAEEAGKLCVGYNKPTPDVAPGAYLTAACFDWAKFYTDNVQSIIDGTWEPASYWNGLADGWVYLADLSDLCPEGAQEAVDAARDAIINGELVLFSGEVKDQDGNVKATDMTNEEIYNMDWFVEGVVGTAN